MKKNIILLLCMISICHMSQAQLQRDSIIGMSVYSLLEKGKYTVKYCDYDSLAKTLFVKKMEIIFTDTTQFGSLYISSSYVERSPFVGLLMVYECQYVQIDGDDGIAFAYDDLKRLPKLKKMLDHMIRITPYTPYKGNGENE